MLKSRPASLGLALLLAMIVDSSGQSQRRSQQMRIKQPEATITQPKSTNEQRGTEQSPLIVKVAPTQKTDDERAEEAKERKRIADSERKKEESDAKLVEFTGELASFTKGLFVATVALVIATFGLGIAAFFQSRDMKASIAAAEKGAEAAMKSAKVAEEALTVLEKPYVFIDRKITLSPTFQQIKIDFDMGHKEIKIRVDYSIINHGRTPAIVRGLFANLVIVDEIPKNRTITGTPVIPPSIAIVQGTPEGPLMCFCNDIVNRQIYEEILQGEKSLFFYGQVSYRDVFSYEYLTGFGWRYFADLWNPAGDDEYNFHMNVSPKPMKKAPFRL